MPWAFFWRFQLRVLEIIILACFQTILEYFDTSDVENNKVGKSSINGKEEIVVKGLEAAEIKLNEFLSYFDKETVERVMAQAEAENELNTKEFDKNLGDIINLKPIS